MSLIPTTEVVGLVIPGWVPLSSPVMATAPIFLS